jgi:hypothetical protein
MKRALSHIHAYSKFVTIRFMPLNNSSFFFLKKKKKSSRNFTPRIYLLEIRFESSPLDIEEEG